MKYCLWLILMCFSGMGYAQTGTLTVKVTSLKNNTGKAQAALYNTEESFPSSNKSEIYRISAVSIENNTATIVFDKLPYGNYAVAVFHDENSSTVLETNWLGIPQEGYGFSNNVKVSFSAPEFEDAKVKVNGAVMIRIKVGY